MPISQPLDRDNLQDYENFLRAYPNDRWQDGCKQLLQPARSHNVAAQSERRYASRLLSYLRSLSPGSHANDARRRLAYLTAALEPPPRFEIIGYDVPPPPPEEVIYVERPVLIFDDPDFGFEPPPPPRCFFLPPIDRLLSWIWLRHHRRCMHIFFPFRFIVPVPVLGQHAGIRCAAAKQCHLQQHPQHGRRQYTTTIPL